MKKTPREKLKSAYKYFVRTISKGQVRIIFYDVEDAVEANPPMDTKGIVRHFNNGNPLLWTKME